MQTGTANSIPTSRAYWELRAEQVMDRVFCPSDSIDVEVLEAPAPPPRPSAALLWFCGGLTGLALVGALLLGLAWSRASQALQQERTLRVLQGLRELRAAGGDTAATPNPTTTAGSEQSPPPPPSEPWMEQLAALDGHGDGTSAAAPLQVPLNGPLTAPPPLPPLPPLPAAATGGATPELVGVVHSPGRSSAAIFRLNGSFSNASSGESIGSSGWRLLSTSGDSALIERGGVSRRVSIGSGL